MLGALALARIGAASFFFVGLGFTGLVDVGRYLRETVLLPLALVAPVLLVVLVVAHSTPLLPLASADRWWVLLSVAALAALSAALCAPVVWFCVLDAGAPLPARHAPEALQARLAASSSGSSPATRGSRW